MNIIDSFEMFMEDLPVVRWSVEHLAANKKHWEKLTKQHKMYEFNRDWYMKFFKKCSDKQILYYVITDMKHFSDWAETEAVNRGLL
jgi:hypothetical protein